MIIQVLNKNELYAQRLIGSLKILSGKTTFRVDRNVMFCCSCSSGSKTFSLILLFTNFYTSFRAAFMLNIRPEVVDDIKIMVQSLLYHTMMPIVSHYYTIRYRNQNVTLTFSYRHESLLLLMLNSSSTIIIGGEAQLAFQNI